MFNLSNQLRDIANNMTRIADRLENLDIRDIYDIDSGRDDLSTLRWYMERVDRVKAVLRDIDDGIDAMADNIGE